MYRASAKNVVRFLEMPYRNKAERDAVLGTVDANPIIAQAKNETVLYKKSFTKIRQRMQVHS